MDPRRMATLAEMEALQPTDAYPLAEFLDDVRAAVWGDMQATSAVDGYRRALQRAWLERVAYLMSEEPTSNAFQGPAPDVSRSDVRPLLRAQLGALRDEVERAVRRIRHTATRAHLEDVLVRIDRVLEAEDEG
jgi:hypothetical protein